MDRTVATAAVSAAGNLSSFVLPQSRQLQHALRPGSAQLLQQRRRPPTASCGAIQAIKQAEATAAPAAPADDESANNDQKNAGSDTAPLVRHAMAELGLSQDAIERILKWYPPYLNCDVEHKLLPAMHRWQQCLGGSFPTEFTRLPMLLLEIPEQEVGETAVSCVHWGYISQKNSSQMASSVFESNAEQSGFFSRLWLHTGKDQHCD
ncbi:TPA: hypothetical protein ACH3X1_000426 [Trebouxia sp. C0004]